MLDKLVDFGKQIFTLKGQVDTNTSDIKELRDDLRELSSAYAKLHLSNNELKLRFAHLKETEGRERDNLTREWQIYQDKYQQDQEIVLLKLTNLIQEEKISRLSEKNQTKLLGREE
jgi:regulator of replication initiation timing